MGYSNLYPTPRKVISSFLELLNELNTAIFFILKPNKSYERTVFCTDLLPPAFESLKNKAFGNYIEKRST